MSPPTPMDRRRARRGINSISLCKCNHRNYHLPPTRINLTLLTCSILQVMRFHKNDVFSLFLLFFDAKCWYQSSNNLSTKKFNLHMTNQNFQKFVCMSTIFLLQSNLEFVEFSKNLKIWSTPWWQKSQLKLGQNPIGISETSTSRPSMY